MRSSEAEGPGRVLRAALLLPLLAGVLAMHVLLLCSDGGGGGSHSGHGSAVPPAEPGASHVMPAAVHAMPVAVRSTLAGALPAARDLAADQSLTGLAACLAVLGVALVLALSRSGSAALLLGPAPAGGAAAHPYRARPPPPVPLHLLLCVSRT